MEWQTKMSPQLNGRAKNTQKSILCRCLQINKLLFAEIIVIISDIIPATSSYWHLKLLFQVHLHFYFHLRIWSSFFSFVFKRVSGLIVNKTKTTDVCNKLTFKNYFYCISLCTDRFPYQCFGAPLSQNQDATRSV